MPLTVLKESAPSSHSWICTTGQPACHPPGITLTASLLASQAVIYRYVAKTYFRLVPAAQRYGIMVWGVADTDSWLYNNGRDFPLLFDKDYNKKPAFLAFLQGLKTR